MTQKYGLAVDNNLSDVEDNVQALRQLGFEPPDLFILQNTGASGVTATDYANISGLTFRFTTSMWQITDATWDFSTKPWSVRKDVSPACVRIWGNGNGIRIANCLFEHVYFPIRIRSLLEGQRIDGVRIEDNEFRYTDNGILTVSDGSGWGYAKLRGRLGDVRVYRNRSYETGTRPTRFCTGTGIQVTCARTVRSPTVILLFGHTIVASPSGIPIE